MCLLRNKYRKYLLLVSFFLIIFGVVFFLFVKDFTPEDDVIFGVTFSEKYARELELNWKTSYLAILDDLNVSHLRLVAYWDDIEAVQGSYDFSSLDWQVAQATQRERKIILTVGRRAPRWPECHDPLWLSNLAPLAVQQQQLEFVKATIERYKDNQFIIAWQIENEPLFSHFGECPKPSKKFLQEEVDLARSLDSRSIIITDSGELNHWQGAASIGDILGTTMYRIVWNEKTGFWEYFFVPPSAYHYKASITKFLHRDLDKIIVTELQMEPWTIGKSMIELTIEEQEKSFDLQRFKDNIIYVQKAGFDEAYLWGVEYWYWLKVHGQSDIWEEAKKLW